ncbi:MAG TPA: hypothetical protein GXX29_05820 [Firmicutes bacterium]|nr:hypothetical protein [Bacillota bacterium]
MKDEKLQILRMLEEGKINADEAFQLLSTLEEKKVVPAPAKTTKFLRIVVNEGESGTKVNVNIPISLIKIAQRFIPKKVLEEHPEINLDEILMEIEKGAEGKLVEVRDGQTEVDIIVE